MIGLYLKKVSKMFIGSELDVLFSHGLASGPILLGNESKLPYVPTEFRLRLSYGLLTSLLRSRLRLFGAAPVGEIGRQADDFDGRFLQRFQAGIDDRPGGAFEHFVG